MTPNEQLELYQVAAVALAEYACGGPTAEARSKDDPTYVEVTEGRDVGAMRARYSSCGDLAHWLLARLGVDAEWLNRKPHYVVGANISRIAWKSPAQWGPFHGDWFPEPGDILLVWNKADTTDAHATVALGLPREGRLRTANYGAAGMSAAAFPGCRIVNHHLRWDGKWWILGNRRVQRHLRLSSIIPLCNRAPDLRGACLSGEEIDAVAACYHL